MMLSKVHLTHRAIVRNAVTRSSLPTGCSAARRTAAAQHRHTALQASSSESEQASAASPPPSAAAPPPAAAAAPSSNSAVEPSSNSSNAGLAGGAVAAGVALFLATRLLTGGPSVAALEQQAVPLDVALSNGKPTVVEFYASWCEVCRELVPAEYEIEQQYKDKVNFVMLNVDNSKWAPEVEEYSVNGIPHFVFMDGNGQALAAAVGRLPREVLEGNVSALAAGKSQLPYAAVRGQTSSLAPPTGMVASSKATSPRDHA